MEESYRSDIQTLPCVNCGKRTNRYNNRLHVVIHAICEEEYKFYKDLDK